LNPLSRNSKQTVQSLVWSRQIKKNNSAAAELTDSAQCHLGDFNEYSRMRIDIKELERLLSKRDGSRSIDQRTTRENRERTRWDASKFSDNIRATRAMTARLAPDSLKRRIDLIVNPKDCGRGSKIEHM
jgi:hypothetical protein